MVTVQRWSLKYSTSWVLPEAMMTSPRLTTVSGVAQVKSSPDLMVATIVTPPLPVHPGRRSVPFLASVRRIFAEWPCRTLNSEASVSTAPRLGV
jgi:hypothetical protein